MQLNVQIKIGVYKYKEKTSSRYKNGKKKGVKSLPPKKTNNKRREDGNNKKNGQTQNN